MPVLARAMTPRVAATPARAATTRPRSTEPEPMARRAATIASASASTSSSSTRRAAAAVASSVPAGALLLFASAARAADDAGAGIAAAGIAVWRPPDGSNPLEGILAGASPIPFVDGSLTGYWFVDAFAYMNLALVTGLLLVPSSPGGGKGEEDGGGGGGGEDGSDEDGGASR